jgi:hypothetical protein
VKFLLAILALFCASQAAVAQTLRVPDEVLAIGFSGTDGGRRGFRESVEALAVTLAVEVRRGDWESAERVATVVLWRRLLASTVNNPVTIMQIIKTPRQFSGLESSPLMRDPVGLAIRIAEFRGIAAAAINGELDGKYPPMTHYARCETFKTTRWGRAALKYHRIDITADGHCWIRGALPFRLPRAARMANKLASWRRCVESSMDMMAYMFPSCAKHDQEKLAAK